MRPRTTVWSLMKLESARALAVVLEEEAVDGAVREEDLGDGFVAAGGEPRGAEVAAADVHRERQVGGLGGDDPVEDADVAAGHGVDVDAAGGVGGALFSGAEFAPARVVELQVAAAALVERQHGVGPGLCEVVEKKLLVVLVGGDRLIVRGAHAADEVQHRRRRDRVLHGGVARDFLQAVEGLEERMVGGEGEAVLDDDRLGLGLTTFEVNGPGLGLDVADALEAGKEVEVPEGAAEFAVGDGGEAVVELLLHERGDLLVLDGGEGFAESSPLANAARACATAAGRRKLPTTSARYGGRTWGMVRFLF